MRHKQKSLSISIKNLSLRVDKSSISSDVYTYLKDGGKITYLKYGGDERSYKKVECHSTIYNL